MAITCTNFFSVQKLCILPTRCIQHVSYSFHRNRDAMFSTMRKLRFWALLRSISGFKGFVTVWSSQQEASLFRHLGCRQWCCWKFKSAGMWRWKSSYRRFEGFQCLHSSGSHPRWLGIFRCAFISKIHNGTVLVKFRRGVKILSLSELQQQTPVRFFPPQATFLKKKSPQYLLT